MGAARDSAVGAHVWAEAQEVDFVGGFLWALGVC
jgi:hypothetical protein